MTFDTDPGWFDDVKTLIDQVRVVKMPPPDKGRGVVAPLALRSRIAHAHGPEQVTLAPLRARDDAVGTVEAAMTTARQGQ